MSIKKGLRDSGVARSQQVEVVEFYFTGVAPSTTGAAQTLVAAQGDAALKVMLVHAGSSSNAGLTGVTSAALQALVSLDGTVTAEQTVLASTLVTYLTSLAATANSARSIGFAVGGTGATDIVKAEVEWAAASVSGAAAFKKLVETAAPSKYGPSDAVPTSLSVSTDKLVTCRGVVAGTIALTDATNGLIAVGDKVTLRLYIRN